MFPKRCHYKNQYGSPNSKVYNNNFLSKTLLGSSTSENNVLSITINYIQQEDRSRETTSRFVASVRIPTSEN